MDATIPFTADVDPQFQELRPGVRETINATEAEMRQAMKEMLDAFPAHLAEHLQAIQAEVPARFIRAMLPFFVGLSQMHDAKEMFDRQQARKSSSHVVH